MRLPAFGDGFLHRSPAERLQRSYGTRKAGSDEPAFFRVAARADVGSDEELSAICGNGGAIDESGVIGHEEDNRARDLLGINPSTRRNLCNNRFTDLFGNGHYHVRADVAWANRISGDVSPRAFLRQ